MGKDKDIRPDVSSADILAEPDVLSVAAARVEIEIRGEMSRLNILRNRVRRLPLEDEWHFTNLLAAKEGEMTGVNRLLDAIASERQRRSE